MILMPDGMFGMIHPDLHSVSIRIYIYIYIYVCVCVCVCVCVNEMLSKIKVKYVV
jgi:hypothetical protein